MISEHHKLLLKNHTFIIPTLHLGLFFNNQLTVLAVYPQFFSSLIRDML